jgi:hypothetical protein
MGNIQGIPKVLLVFPKEESKANGNPAMPDFLFFFKRLEAS